MIKKCLLLVTFICIYACYAYTQVAINSDGRLPDNSAMLDVSSESKGILIPRVTLISNTDIVTVNNPTEGLLVYNTGDNDNFKIKGFVYWNGNEWRIFLDNSTEYNPSEPDSPSPEYSSTSFSGRYFDQETNGIKLGDFKFRFYVRPSEEGRYTTTDDKINIQIKYVGTKASVSLASFASSEFERASYAEDGKTAFGLGDLRNTNVLNKDVWYGWGASGIETASDIEKRQYTFMSSDPDENYFYICEFMVVDFTGNTFSDTKVFMHIKRVISKNSN